MHLRSAFGTANCQLGVVGSAKAVLRKEGLAVLYLGMQPSLLREIPYGGLRMGMYEPVREQLAAAFARQTNNKQTNNIATNKQHATKNTYLQQTNKIANNNKPTTKQPSNSNVVFCV
ncbi:unnamed protein product [Polarella glacialis]|uniref:Uncharacterized protein n=1 Tax=Polarella glacialis TaxID=89957 RepID=A0A813H4A9_POLGL|nr:unnamed protein product [Polarella glacialis]